MPQAFIFTFSQALGAQLSVKGVDVRGTQGRDELG